MLALALHLTVDWVQTTTRFEGSLALYYLIPVCLMSWYGSWWAGMLLGLVSASPWWSLEPGRGYAGYRQYLAYWDSAMEAALYATLALALSTLKQALDRERALARTDSLTGAVNPRAFEEAARLELERARRTGRPVTLAYLDLDGFKAVNDSLGHAAGDEALKAIAQAIRSQVRTLDVFARLGGDEFVLLMPETTAVRAREPLERVRRALQHASSAKNLAVTASIGATCFPIPPATIKEMLRIADTLMYEAKKCGKDRIILREVSCGQLSKT